MTTEQFVKLSELKQNPSGVVARAQAGETFIVTVQNRPAAMLGPLQEPRRWATRADLAAYRATPGLSAKAVAAWLADIDEDAADVWDLNDPFEPAE